MIERRRAIIAAQNEFIPPEYQKYDYLQLRNTKSYFDTGVAGNDNTIKLDFAIFVETRGNWAPIFGNYNGNNQTTCWMFRHGADINGFNFVCNNRKVAESYGMSFSTSAVQKKIDIHMEYGKAKMTYNGETQSAQMPPSSGSFSESTYNIFIGDYATHQNNEKINRFYYFRVSSGGKLIRNYIPVVRKSDSKAGFYDTVNYTFNPSIGTVDFVAGND